MDESRPDDFATVFRSVFGDFDPNADYIRATDTNGHYEQVWNAELRGQVKCPPRVAFMLDKLAASPNNKLRNRNDAIRSCMVIGLHFYHEREKNLNPVLAAELEMEVRELAAQSRLAYLARCQEDDKARCDGIVALLSTPYDQAVEYGVANELIPMLRNEEYIIKCRRMLEDYRRHH